MTYTEEEASKKFCHQTMPSGRWERCVTSNCMAWGWIAVEDVDGTHLRKWGSCGLSERSFKMIEADRG